MKKTLSLILALSLFSQVSLADTVCAQPVLAMHQGDSVPCSGFLFSPEMEKEVRQMKENYDKLVELNKDLTDLSAIKDDEINVISKNLDATKAQLNFDDKKNVWENVLWFAAGVLATGAAVYLARK